MHNSISQTKPSTSKNIFDNLPALQAPRRSELRDELERFLSTDPEHVEDVLLWWFEHKHMYPQLALDYLTIPGMIFHSPNPLFTELPLVISVKVEWTFSQGRLVLSHVWSRLGVQSTRALLCLGVWSLMGYVKDGDIKAAVVVPELIDNEPEEELAYDWDAL